MRTLRRLRRQIVAELRAAASAIHEPHAMLSAGRLARLVLQYRIKPQDALLYDLDRRPVAAARTFLTKRSHTLLQDQLNPPEHHHLVQSKLDYHLACIGRGVAAPPILAIVDSRCDTEPSSALGAFRIGNETDMVAFLTSFAAPTRLVFKAVTGSYGKGLLVLTAHANDLTDAEGRTLHPNDVLRYCESDQDKNGFLVQRGLAPHPGLRPLMPGPGLGTVRVVTLLAGDEVCLPYAFVKIPVGGNLYDSFHYGRTGNLIAAVDVATGQVGPVWGPSRTRPYRLEIYSTHPDNGAAIEGVEIPQWREAVQVVSHAARAFWELRMLGWDVAITSEGIFLLEGNHHWDPHSPQILFRRGYRPDMEEFVAQASAYKSS